MTVSKASQWRGWGARLDGGGHEVTSLRLGTDAAVQNRWFPKVRSWLALGAPLELLSPLSVARSIALIAAIFWPLALLATGAGFAVPFVMLMAGTLAVIAALLRTRELTERQCHAFAAAGAVGAGVFAWTGHGDAMMFAGASVVVLAAVFVGLFLPVRAIAAHELFAAVMVGVGSLGGLSWGRAIIAAAITLPMMLIVGLTVGLAAQAARTRSSIDPDTGLLNGWGLAAQLELDGSGPLVVATLVLPGLADAREALGSQIGTEMLRRVVEDVGQVLPPGAQIGRVEGDELVVVLGMGAGQVPIHRLADDFANVVSRAIRSGRYLVGGVQVSLRVYVGSAVAPDDGDDITELARCSSVAAKRAVSSGVLHARWGGVTSAMTAGDLALLADLRFAADNGELSLAYQPQASAVTGAAVSVEALLRWTSPVHGNVSPGVFIPLAERTGLLDPLTDWVLSEALDAQVRWRASGIDLPVSINLSPRSLSDPTLTQRILRELHVRSLPPTVLTIEVTETAAIDLVQAVDRLRLLHDFGIGVSIDDFGTGYTSLSVLPHLPLDELKVDQRFVRALLTSNADAAIVHSIVDLAHRLGLRAVAEGVETGELSTHLVALGFDLLQGYHFSRPLAEAELIKFSRSFTPTWAADQDRVRDLVDQRPGMPAPRR